MLSVRLPAPAAPPSPRPQESSPAGSAAADPLQAGPLRSTWRAPELEGFDPIELGARRGTGPPDELWILAMVMTMTTVVFLLLMNQ